MIRDLTATVSYSWDKLILQTFQKIRNPYWSVANWFTMKEQWHHSHPLPIMKTFCSKSRADHHKNLECKSTTNLVYKYHRIKTPVKPSTEVMIKRKTWHLPALQRKLSKHLFKKVLIATRACANLCFRLRCCKTMFYQICLRTV